MAVGFNNRPANNSAAYAALKAWREEIVWRVCEDCGEMFRGTRMRRYCDECRDQRSKESDERYEAKRGPQRKEARRRARLAKERMNGK